jgi:ubiquinone/menaquinone biosynthesis C-methylase UbiE
MEKEYAEYLLEKTKKDYDLIAGEFSQTRGFLWEELKKFKDLIKEGEKVLDLGCGNGRLLEILQDKEIEYIGVDSSWKLIEIAKEKHPNFQFLVADALSLPFLENSFDKVFSISVFHHIPSEELRLQFLKEIKRILKPKGILILTVWNLWQKRYFLLILKFTLLKIFFRSKLDFKDIFIPWGKKIDRYFHCFTKSEIEKLIKKVNLKILNSGKLKSQSGRYHLYLIAQKPL